MFARVERRPGGYHSRRISPSVMLNVVQELDQRDNGMGEEKIITVIDRKSLQPDIGAAPGHLAFIHDEVPPPVLLLLPLPRSNALRLQCLSAYDDYPKRHSAPQNYIRSAGVLQLTQRGITSLLSTNQTRTIRTQLCMQPIGIVSRTTPGNLGQRPARTPIQVERFPRAAGVWATRTSKGEHSADAPQHARRGVCHWDG